MMKILLLFVPAHALLAIRPGSVVAHRVQFSRSIDASRTRPLRRSTVRASALDSARAGAVIAACSSAASIAERSTRWGAAMTGSLVAFALGAACGNVGALAASGPAHDACWSVLLPMSLALTLVAHGCRLIN